MYGGGGGEIGGSSWKAPEDPGIVIGGKDVSQFNLLS